MKKVKKKVVQKKKVKGKNGKMEYVDEVVEVEEEVPVMVKKKKRIPEDDEEYTRNIDKTIDPLDYDGTNNKRGPNKRRDIEDDAFESIERNRRRQNKKGVVMEESDEAEEMITLGGTRRKR